MKIERRDSYRARNFALGLIIASALLLVIATIATFYFSPENNANRELERIAKEYYETYLYGKSLSTFENGTEGFADFREKGFYPVKLRQLLLYNGGQNRNSQKLFTSDAYKCSLDDSVVIYRPVPPYGAKNYTIEYQTKCEKQA